jgi:hypothetical protein
VTMFGRTEAGVSEWSTVFFTGNLFRTFWSRAHPRSRFLPRQGKGLSKGLSNSNTREVSGRESWQYFSLSS